MLDFAQIKEELEKIRINNDLEKLQEYKKVLADAKIEKTFADKIKMLEFLEENPEDKAMRLSIEVAIEVLLIALKAGNTYGIIFSHENLSLQTVIVALASFILVDILRITFKNYYRNKLLKNNYKEQLLKEITDLKDSLYQYLDLEKDIKEIEGDIEKRQFKEALWQFVDTYGPDINLDISKLAKMYGVEEDELNPEFNHFIKLIERYKEVLKEPSLEEEKKQIIDEFRLIRKKNQNRG